MADYKKLSSDESGLLELSDFSKINKSAGQESQSLLNIRFSSPKKSSKLEFISSTDSPQNQRSPTSPFSNFSFNFNMDSLAPSFLIKKSSSSPPLPFSMNRARKGNMIMALYNEDDSPFIVIGPEWIIPLLYLSIILSIIFFYCYYLWSSLSFQMKLIGVVIMLGEVFLFTFCAITNPGIPSKNLWVENYYKNKGNNNMNYSYGICKECKLIKRNTDAIEHCEKCGVCIVGRKKHSFLLSKCIGDKNKIIYYIVLGINISFIIYIIFGWINVGFFMGDDNNKENNEGDTKNNNDGFLKDINN